MNIAGKLHQSWRFFSLSGRKRWHWLKEISATSLVITKTRMGGALAGNANGSSMNNVGSNGNYWSSTENDTNNAYYMNFNTSNANTNNTNKNNGFQVRCVK
ncbi:MAG: hypothetical protein LBN98_03325 [Prevotellaceae bacterium]|nr:hypothetical protein [Prevotellaceae bacterium]